MNNWYEIAQKQSFWNIVFKILVVVLLAAIFLSLSSISHSLRKGLHSENSMKWQTKEKKGGEWKNMEKKEEMKKGEKVSMPIPEDGKLPEVKKEILSSTGEKETEKKGWWIFGSNEREAVTVISTGTKIVDKSIPDVESRYNFRCDGGTIMRIYEGKYQIGGQKSSLEGGTIALDDPQTGRMHFLSKTSSEVGKAVYEKIVSVQEEKLEVKYNYSFSSLSNGTATFTKNGKDIYSNCSLVR